VEAGELQRLTEAVAAGGVRLELSDPPGSGARARWYAIWLQPSLFGGVDVIRCWGRLGTTTRRPRRLASAHPDQAAARAALDELLARRWRRGYRPAGAPGVRTGGHGRPRSRPTRPVRVFAAQLRLELLTAPAASRQADGR
jgi:predicted DNA-binding WGR domain protein